MLARFSLAEVCRRFAALMIEFAFAWGWRPRLLAAAASQLQIQ